MSWGLFHYTPVDRMVMFWAGLDNPASTKLSSKMYRLQRETGRVSWSTHVRDALIRYGSGMRVYMALARI